MYNAKFENVPGVFWAPGLAAVPVAVKKLVRLNFLVLVLVNMPDQGELTHLVHVHDPMHNSDLIHVISYYLHSFMVLLLAF